jgi:hypothetical protein
VNYHEGGNLLDILILSLVIPTIISIIALIVSIIKLSIDKHSAERQIKNNKKMVEAQLNSQKELFQKQIESQKEAMENQLKLQKETVEKQISVQKEIFEKQIEAQQEIIIIMRKELSILESGLKEINVKKGLTDWEKAYKQQEMELKQKREGWKQMKDLAKFVQYIAEE